MYFLASGFRCMTQSTQGASVCGTSLRSSGFALSPVDKQSMPNNKAARDKEIMFYPGG